MEIIEQSFESGAKQKSSYVLNGEKVGIRLWEEDGMLSHEHGIRNGKKHGRDYNFRTNGEPYEVTPYRNSKIHGQGIQWADNGSVLITYKMSNGVGLDLWCDQLNGTLAEEMYWVKQGQLGYRRDWNADDKTVYAEYFFVFCRGYHGIWREWNSKGRLRRGFPHFFVNDLRVTKQKYLKAAEVDPILPPYIPEEDLPDRILPLDYLAQRPKQKT
jgi:hypothetical protein